MSNQKKLVIIKISGASLKGANDIIDINVLNDLAVQIKDISSSYKVAIVLGGGNIWRGNIAKDINMERYKADQMGMLSTVMNSLAFQSALKNLGVKANIFSTVEMEKIADNYIIRHLKDSLDRDEVALLACGTGRPYFTTDTGIAVSAAELGASYILMGKNNVDGVYDKDPNIYSDAKFYEHLTYTEAIAKDLKVMDATAASICKQTDVKTIVFKINEPHGIVNILNLNSRFTLISENEEDFQTFGFLKNNQLLEESLETNIYVDSNSLENNFEEEFDEEFEEECGCDCECESSQEEDEVYEDEIFEQTPNEIKDEIKIEFEPISENNDEIEQDYTNIKEEDDLFKNIMKNLSDTPEEKKDYTDEEVEGFLEEEIPIYGKLKNEEVDSIENFLKEVKELENNLKNNKVQEEEIKEETDEYQKDFATEFFTWKSKNFGEQENNKEVENKNNESTTDDFVLKTDINYSIPDNLFADDDFVIDENKTDENKVIEFEEINANVSAEIEEKIGKILEDQKIINEVLQEAKNIVNEEINNKIKLEELNENKASNNFMENIDFYIEEIQKIKNNIIEENKNKTNEIRMSFEKKK